MKKYYTHIQNIPEEYYFKENEYVIILQEWLIESNINYLFCNILQINEKKVTIGFRKLNDLMRFKLAWS